MKDLFLKLFEKLADGLPRHGFAYALVSTVCFFLVKLIDVTNDVAVLSALLIFALCWTLDIIFTSIWNKITDKNRKQKKVILAELGDYHRYILKMYVTENKRVNEFSCDVRSAMNLNYLLDTKILFLLARGKGNRGTTYYQIDKFAFDYLSNHPNLLTVDEKRYSEIKEAVDRLTDLGLA